MVGTTCSRCGASFAVKPYRFARNQSGLLFCSVACRQADGTTLGLRQPVGPDLICPVCGEAFHRKKAELRAVNYCSYVCAAKGTGNLRPAPKGERRSPGTEFRSGQRPVNWEPLGTVKVRTHRGVRRAWIKVADPNVWRHRAVVVWELANGPLPTGHVVHHRNRDTLDDRIGNLMALSRAAHLNEHR